MARSPLEQFAIISLIPIHIGNLYLSFTNLSFFLSQLSIILVVVGRSSILKIPRVGMYYF